MKTSKSLHPINHMLGNFLNTSLSDWLGAEFVNQTPSVNIKESDKDFDIEVAAPGLTKKDFAVEIKENRLTIKAHLESKEEENKEHFFRKEFNYHSFERAFTLPENVDPETIKAEYKNGMLAIKVLKIEPEAAKSHTIEIK